MERIIALSDTHLKDGLPQRLIDVLEGADIILHAGDFISLDVYESLAEQGRLEAVCGNADLPELRQRLPARKVIEVEGISIGLVHMASHSADLTGAEMMAREMDVSVLVFGHIHRPIIEKGKRLLICPGSPTMPRMAAPTVAELVINDNSISGNIVSLGSPACDYLKFAASLDERKN
jgi:putative phosphoesterase